MANLKNIKQKILSYKKTGTVTHAMEAVSAVKMRKGQERAMNGRAYAAAALSILERISGTADASRHPLMTHVGHGVSNMGSKTCFIVVTSDKGLAGSFNSSVIRRTEQEIVRLNLDKTNVIIIGIGRRGAEYFASRGFDVRERLENISDDVSEPDTKRVTDKLIEWHHASEVGECYVIYTNFISTFEQEAISRQIVPIEPQMLAALVAGIRPARGKYAPQASASDTKPTTYTIEPDPDAVLAELLPKLLNIAVFHALLEAKASEHSARMVAMKNATDKAKEMAHNLTRTFNKVRQAAITREVSEITSGIEAMK